MKTRSNLFLFLLVSMVIAFVGCAGDTETEEAGNAVPQPIVVTPTTDMTGFWPQFQAAVAQNDKDAVVQMTDFPLNGTDYTTNDPANLGLTEAAFLQQYDEIFTPEMKQLIASTTVDQLGLMRAHEGNNLTTRTQVPVGSPMYTLRTEGMEGIGTDQERLVKKTFVFGIRNETLKFLYILRM